MLVLLKCFYELLFDEKKAQSFTRTESDATTKRNESKLWPIF